ncbi:MAG: D-alanyl-D-alanine carboxypeptidase/D-alanyl-D-alanine-endopeptidase [Chthonomonadales bacterium]|nr:D-alanyl-D-alanine carboxypeptidase/D-alanyl-D-alanine-endopeptidase [Chthonomonadales bacterium]
MREVNAFAARRRGRRLLGPALAALLLCAAATASARADDMAALAERLDACMASPELRGGIRGIVVESLRDGAVLYRRNPDVLFLPASNQKLLTSAAALHLLGPDWRFVTALLATGRLDADGVLHGDLFLRGGGDPLLTEGELGGLVRAAWKVGIRRVEGGVVGDGSCFPGPPYGDGWAWDDMSFYYSAAVAGLNVNENVVRVFVDPGRTVGAPARARVEPAAGMMVLKCAATTSDRGAPPSLNVGRALGLNRIEVGGTLPPDAPAPARGPIRVTVDDPPLYAAWVLAERLRRVGIVLRRPPRTGVTPRSAREIARHAGLAFAEVLKRLNKPSDNLVAECLLRAMGMAHEGKGTVGAGRGAALRWFTEIGMDPEGIDMADGSGLSRQNLVTPGNLARLLRHMQGDPLGPTYIASLPIAGVDGTLHNRMKGTPAQGNCRAKSGYVSSVSSLSGYVTAADGEPLLFVILMNNHRARNAVAMAAQDRFVEALASWRRGTAGPAAPAAGP